PSDSVSPGSAGFGANSPRDPADVLGRPKAAAGGSVAGVAGSGLGAGIRAQPDLGRPVGIGSTGAGVPASPSGAGAPGLADQAGVGAPLGFAPSHAGSPGDGVPGSSGNLGAPDGRASTPVRPATVGTPHDESTNGAAATGEIAGQQTAHRGGTAGLLSNSPI